MSNRSTVIALNISSLVVLVSAASLLAPVIERIIAAFTEWQKFGDSGHIMLSRNTGLIYFGFLGVVLLAAVLCNAAATRYNSRISIILSRIAILTIVIAGITYLCLGMSSFNAWRA